MATSDKECELLITENVCLQYPHRVLQDDVTHKKSEMACSRVKQLLSNTETESQLQSCQLSDFIPFMSNPLDLVVRIYTAKSNAAHKDSGNSMSKLQIMVAIFNSSMEKESLKLHCIVNAIGKRHAVNLDKVRLMLVQKWLTQDESHFKDILLPSTRFQVYTYLSPQYKLMLNVYRSELAKTGNRSQ